jgi:hypothetical protein
MQKNYLINKVMPARWCPECNTLKLAEYFISEEDDHSFVEVCLTCRRKKRGESAH